MKISTLISHSAELLKIVFKSAQPADKIASDYFKRKKYIGSKERKFISEITFHTLRNYTLLINLSNDFCDKFANNIPENIKHPKEFFAIISGIILYKSITDENTNKLIEIANLQHNQSFENEINLIEIIVNDLNISVNAQDITDFIKLKFENINNQLSNTQFRENSLITKRYSINESLLNSLDKYLDLNQKINLIKSLNKSAPLTIRINDSLIDIKSAIKYFEENSIEITKTHFSPTGITLKNRINLGELSLFKQGFFEVQDEGSQLISYALSPQQNSRILDACSGAGGKSLHIANLCSDNCEIISSDIDNRKLNELRKRAAKSNFTSIRTVHIHHKFNFKKSKEFIKKFDYILIDAPCSGTGTTRRMPIPKYRINDKLIQRLQQNQIKILNQYAQFLKPGGILVYATCSILYEENQEVVKNFLSDNNNFQPEPIMPAFLSYSISIPELKENDFTLNLLPSIHNTDGFFIAKFRKEL